MAQARRLVTGAPLGGFYLSRLLVQIAEAGFQRRRHFRHDVGPVSGWYLDGRAAQSGAVLVKDANAVAHLAFHRRRRPRRQPQRRGRRSRGSDPLPAQTPVDVAGPVSGLQQQRQKDAGVVHDRGHVAARLETLHKGLSRQALWVEAHRHQPFLAAPSHSLGRLRPPVRQPLAPRSHTLTLRSWREQTTSVA